MKVWHKGAEYGYMASNLVLNRLVFGGKIRRSQLLELEYQIALGRPPGKALP